MELVVTEEQRRDPPAGNELSAGKVNRPLLCGREKKPFHDGSGLCFQGRRRPEEREVSPFILPGKRWLQLKSEDEVRRDVFSLAKGGTREAPFGEEVVEKARKLWVKFLLERGMRSEEELWVREERQPFMLAALQQHLEVMKDPDAGAFEGFRQGVLVGAHDNMPRAAEVFEAKVKWKAYEEVPLPTDKENYTSAKDDAPVLQKQFRKEEALGAMVEVEEAWARERYGEEFRLAALAALEKSDKSFRVVHDGTHGVGVNSKIKVLDQLRYPGPGEVRKALEVLHPVTFCLAADVSRAHRLVKVREQDWGLMSCKTGVNDDGTASTKVWLNCVGTFGITSASYHFTRLFGAILRAGASLRGRAPCFELGYVDDLLYLAQGRKGIEAISLAWWARHSVGASVGEA